MITDKKEKLSMIQVSATTFAFRGTLNIQFEDRDGLGISLKKISSKDAVVFGSRARFRNESGMVG